jgi:hypothetical protein
MTKSFSSSRFLRFNIIFTILENEKSEKAKGNPEISEKLKPLKSNFEFGKQQIPVSLKRVLKC